jgi:cell envelope opacity-associated protein A
MGWAADQGIAKDYEALCQDERAVTLIEEEIADFTTGFKRYEIPKVIALVADEFTTENGLLTPSLKIKRRKVVDRYADLLEKLHSTKPTKSGPAKAKKSEAAEAAEEAKELEPKEKKGEAEEDKKKAEGSGGEKKKSDAKSKPSKGGEATPPAA